MFASEQFSGSMDQRRNIFAEGNDFFRSLNVSWPAKRLGNSVGQNNEQSAGKYVFFGIAGRYMLASEPSGRPQVPKVTLRGLPFGAAARGK